MKLKTHIICLLTIFISFVSGGALPQTQESDCQSNVCGLWEKVSRLEVDREVLKTEIRYINKMIDDRTLWVVGTLVFLLGFLGLGSISVIRRIVLVQVSKEVEDQRLRERKEIEQQQLEQQATSALQKIREYDRRAQEAKQDEEARKRIEELEKYGADAGRSSMYDRED